jgi:hypothetical protein
MHRSVEGRRCMKLFGAANVNSRTNPSTYPLNSSTYASNLLTYGWQCGRTPLHEAIWGWAAWDFGEGLAAVTLNSAPYTLHRTPHTLHPTPFLTPYTLHPYPLHPTPFAIKPFTLHPTPFTLHPTPYTLHPSPTPNSLTPYTLHYLGLSLLQLTILASPDSFPLQGCRMSWARLGLDCLI